jgi:hypothetical protein
MDFQIKHLVKICYFQLKNISRIRKFKLEDACRTLNRSLVMSRLDYGNGLLFSVKATSLNKLQSVQNTAAWFVTRSSPIYISLHWLPVVFRIQYKILLNTIKVLHGLSPVYIQDLVRTYNPTRSIRSEDSCMLAKPSVRAKMYGDWRFDVASSSLWNDLPKILPMESSINVFKRNLKTHLFKSF